MVFGKKKKEGKNLSAEAEKIQDQPNPEVQVEETVPDDSIQLGTSDVIIERQIAEESLPEWSIFSTPQKKEEPQEAPVPQEQTQPQESQVQRESAPVTEEVDSIVPEQESNEDSVSLSAVPPISEPDQLQTEEPEYDVSQTVQPEPQDVSAPAETQFTFDHSEDASDSLLVSSLSALDKDVSDEQLNSLLDRLDMTDSIRRMNESAQEDMADVIQRDESTNELLSAKPTEEFHNLEIENEDSGLSLDGELSLDDIGRENEDSGLSLDGELSLDDIGTENEDSGLSLDGELSLPKYEKPDFDFKMEPISQPLQDNQDGSISEYDTVPTVSDLENKWAQEKETTQKNESGFAFSLDDVEQRQNELSLEPEEVTQSDEFAQSEVLEEPKPVENIVESIEPGEDIQNETFMQNEIRTHDEFVKKDENPTQDEVAAVLEDESQVDEVVQEPQVPKVIHVDEITRTIGTQQRSYYRIRL